MPDPKDVSADSSTADTKTQVADDASLDLQGDVVPEGPLHKSERWKERNEKAKVLDELGGAESVRAQLAQLAYYQSLIAGLDEKRTPDEPKTDEQKVREQERTAARAALKEVAPEFESIEPMAANMKVYYESVEAGADEETERLMEEAGMPVTPKDKRAMADILTSIIKEDRSLHLKYIRFPEKAVELAFKRFTEQFTASGKRKDAASTQRSKEHLSKLPKPVLPGGGVVGGEKVKPPTNMQEANAAAKEFFKQYTG